MYWIDLQAIQTPSHGRGIGRYSLELTYALLDIGASIAGIGLNPSIPRPPRIPDKLRLSNRLTWTTAAKVAEAVKSEPFVHVTMSPMESVQPSEAIFPPWLGSDGVGSAAIIYDVIPYLYPERYAPNRHAKRFFQARELMLRQYDVLLAISEHTRQDVIKHWGIHPSRVATIGSGASDYFHPPSDSSEPFHSLQTEIPGLREQFVLSVAGSDWRKNINNLIDAWAAVPLPVRKNFQLVLTCQVPDGVAARWIDRGIKAGLSPGDIIVTGYVSDGVLKSLYQASELFIFPSRYEGFGLPILEAARCGTPSITSNSSSLPEILNLPSSTFDPDDPSDISETISRALCDAVRMDELTEAAATAADFHTWNRVAERLVAATAEVRSKLSGQTRLPRVAVIGTPGLRDELIEAMPNHQVTEAFGPGRKPHELLGPVRLLGNFDVVVAVVQGDEPTSMLEAFEAVDVLVLATDTVVDTHIAAGMRDPRPDFAARAVRATCIKVYGSDVADRFDPNEILDTEVWKRAGLGFLPPLTRGASLVVVADQFLAGQVALDCDPQTRLKILVAGETPLADYVSTVVESIASTSRHIV